MNVNTPILNDIAGAGVHETGRITPLRDTPEDVAARPAIALFSDVRRSCMQQTSRHGHARTRTLDWPRESRFYGDK
jgi:hypothetical protein